MRAVHNDGVLGGGPLFAERIGVVPYGAGIGSGVGRRNGGSRSCHRSTLRSALSAARLRCGLMAGEPGVVVTLDGRLHDPAAPLLHADDLAAVRGDGVFETLLIRDGRPCLLDAHLSRLTQSARLIDLPDPDVSRWRTAVSAAVAQWTSQTGEGVLRLVYSRGREGGSPPTGVRHGRGVTRASGQGAA